MFVCVVCFSHQNIETFVVAPEPLTSLTSVSALSAAYFVLSVAVLASQWAANWRPDFPSENLVSFPSWLTFSWLATTFYKGFKSDKLDVEDLPEINNKIDVKYILNTFMGHLNTTKKFFHTKTLTVLVKSFGGSFVIGGFLRMLNDILLYMTPLVFRKIIQTIENEEPAWQGYLWVVLLFLTATVQVDITAKQSAKAKLKNVNFI